MTSVKDRWLMLLWVLIITLAFVAIITAHDVAILLLSMCCFIFGLYVFSRFIVLVRTSLNAKAWQPVEYQVVDSAVTMEPRSGMQAGNNYLTSFRVEYHFNGHTYLKRDVDCDVLRQNIYFTLQKAEGYINEVNGGLYGSFIYVNPNNPEEVMFSPGVKLIHIKWFFASLLFCVPSVLGAIFVIMRGY